MAFRMTYGGEDVNIKGTKAVKVIGIVIILNAIIGPGRVCSNANAYVSNAFANS